MTEASFTHFLQPLLADIRTRADQPVLCEKKGAGFQTLTLRETVSRLGSLARSLSASGIEPGDRVAMQASPSIPLLICEWAALAVKAVVVIAPEAFSMQELTDTLIESKSKLVIVDTLATARYLAAHAAALPDLQHIVCNEDGPQVAPHVLSWSDFNESGRMEPDRSTALLRSITPKDTALMFYYLDEHGFRQATRYTHALLLKHMAHMESLLADAILQEGERVLSATPWEHALGHIASYYAPVLNEALIQITSGNAELSFFEHAPQATVAGTPYFEKLHRLLLARLQEGGKVESSMLAKALSLSKQRYELHKTPGMLSKLLWSFLHVTVVRKAQNLLGGKMRLFICTDDDMHYDTELFFQMLDITLVELPQDMFR